MIKQVFFSFAFIFAASMTTFAQRTAIVDVNALLESVPEYQQAQQEVDRIAAVWQQEIAQEYDKIKSMYNKYQSEQVLLSEEARRTREDEIMNKEKEVRELQKQKFGAEGELFVKRQELIQPVQEKVFSAIQEYAEQRGYDIILDKSGGAGILYSNDEYDKTEDIRKRLK
jgi:outer membrane protein